MRTFALYERNKKILALTVLVTLAAFIFAVGILLTGNNFDTLSAEIAAFGCPLGTSHSKHSESMGAGGDLVTVLLRDGSVYFALMIISNACNIGTYTMGNPFTRGSASTVTNVVSSVMISRLIFNLRNPKIRLPVTSNRTSGNTTEAYPEISTVRPYMTEYTMNTQWSTAEDDL
ncbi:hypothetical protein B0H14DRAFT_2591041 [Mycena olivaceomarginata]|nr:hypothetical protein B0H14DRAFT_2591041 [Mycena olivaceomarginata]